MYQRDLQKIANPLGDNKTRPGLCSKKYNKYQKDNKIIKYYDEQYYYLNLHLNSDNQRSLLQNHFSLHWNLYYLNECLFRRRWSPHLLINSFWHKFKYFFSCFCITSFFSKYSYIFFISYKTIKKILKNEKNFLEFNTVRIKSLF